MFPFTTHFVFVFELVFVIVFVFLIVFVFAVALRTITLTEKQCFESATNVLFLLSSAITVKYCLCHWQIIAPQPRSSFISSVSLPSLLLNSFHRLQFYFAQFSIICFFITNLRYVWIFLIFLIFLLLCIVFLQFVFVAFTICGQNLYSLLWWKIFPE